MPMGKPLKRIADLTAHGPQWEIVSTDPTLEIITARLKIQQGGWLYIIECKDAYKIVTFVTDR